MEIKYFTGYKTTNTLYVVIHNTGGLLNDPLASTANLVPNDVELDHKMRFNMFSSLYSHIGYNFFISKNGIVFQARAIGEETAAQKNFNQNGVAISICLAGNFTTGVDKPTHQQISALKNLLAQLPAAKIVPHRFLQPSTGCYGSGLSDEYFNDIIKEDLQNKLSLYQQILVLLQQLKSMGYLGSGNSPCHEAAK